MRLAIFLTTLLWTVASYSENPPGAGGEAKAPVKRPFNIGPDTTVVTGPVRADGTIDYVAAMNEAMSAGVTDENNAGVTLMGAIGAGQNGPAMVRIRAAMKIAAPADGLVEIDGALQDEYSRILEAGAPWKAADAPGVAKWLEQSAGPLDRMVAGSKRTRFYIPMIGTPGSRSMVAILLPYLHSIRTVSGGLEARALLKLGNQDFEGFRQDIMATIRFSRLVSESPFLIGSLVAVGAESMGNSAINSVSSRILLSVAQCQTLLGDLQAMPPAMPISKSFEKAERFTMLDYIQVAAVHGPFAAARYLQGDADDAPKAAIDTSAHDWNQAMRKINWWYDQLAAAGRQTTHRMRVADGAKIEAALAAMRNQHPGALAALMDIEDRSLMIMLPASMRILTRQTQIEQERVLVQLGLMLRAHKARTGKFPQSIAEVWPKTSPVPEDLFTEQPLIYKQQGEGYLLYSVGENGRDDGGVRENRKDDIAIRAER